MKRLTLSKKKSDGRNNQGLVTVRNLGCGNFRRARLIDNFRIFRSIKGRVLSFFYTTDRSARLALVLFDNGFLAYHLAIETVSLGDLIYIGKGARLVPGNSKCLYEIPFGFRVSSVDLLPSVSKQSSVSKNSSFGAKVARAAGTSCLSLKRVGSYTLLKLRSGELRWLHSQGYATIGVVSPKEHRFRKKKQSWQFTLARHKTTCSWHRKKSCRSSSWWRPR